MFIAFFIPGRVETACHIGNGRKTFHGVEVDASKNNTDLLFKLFFILVKIQTEHIDAAPIRLDHVKHSFKGCAFSGSVFSNQTHNTAWPQSKRYVLQEKIGVGFCKILNSQKIVANVFFIHSATPLFRHARLLGDE